MLDPHTDRTGDVWHLEVAGLPESFEYHFRVDSFPRPVLDPRAPALAGGEVWGWTPEAVRELTEGAEPRWRAYRGLVPAALPAILDEAARPVVADARRIVCELHARGYTRHPSSEVAAPGTYAGLIERLPRLRDLGVTTIELLPVAEFDETENRRRNPETGERLVNFWGYSPVSFFAPKASYAVAPGGGRELFELRALADACHAAGLELVVDVVFNHTAEAGLGRQDPVRSLAALAPEVYYILDRRVTPLDLTGCGNTVNLNHPVVRRLVLDALRWWVERLGVDGFRFDLAAALFRGPRGEVLDRSPLAEEIAADPVLSRRLLIAEPWDATGFDASDRFPLPWRVWNGRFRDALRRAQRGDGGIERELALRLSGSPDRFAAPRCAAASIQFVTCHDGFTLADLVTYTAKRNLPNGEGNRDGWSDNLATNGGVEGPTDDPRVTAARRLRRRNLLAQLLLARGTPMLLGGDEVGNTQHGNNNAWCQDNETGWVVWPAGEGELEAWVRDLLALRRELTAESALEIAASGWGAAAFPIGFAGDEARTELMVDLVLPACAADGGPAPSGQRLLLAFNGGEREVRFPVPRSPWGTHWALRLDTGADPPGPWSRAAAPRLAPGTGALAVAPGAVRVLTLVADPPA